MVRKSLSIMILMLCLGLILSGCPKKTVVKEEPSIKKAEEVGKTEKAAKEEAAKPKEKEFEKSLEVKKYPGIEGEVFESKLLKDVHFDFDKYNIRPGDAEILKGNADLLKKYPNVKIQIEGHCDERGTVEYNLALGERRANSAKNYLLSIGIPTSQLSTITYGNERPLDPGHNEEAWTKNRRAHSVIISK